MNDEYSSMAATGMIHATESNFRQIADCMTEPSVMYRPSLSIDGNQWCALYGEDLQGGVAGFGISPQHAMWDFNKNWNKVL